MQNKSTHLSTGAKVRADSIHFVPSWHVIRSNLCYKIGVQLVYLVYIFGTQIPENPCNSTLLSLLLVQTLHGGEELQTAKATIYSVFSHKNQAYTVPTELPHHRKSGKISGENSPFSSIQPEPSLQVCESILLFLAGQVGVNIHRRSDVGVSHNLLYNLQCIGIGGVFAHPRAEGMPEMMG